MTTIAGNKGSTKQCHLELQPGLLV